MRDEKILGTFMYEFIDSHEWLEPNFREQLRALFMTICLIGNVDADTALCGRMTREMYEKLIAHDIDQRIDLSYDDFANFMIQYIV
ncbi:MAG: hypothetical protein K2K56_04405 [Lachnospiraceae bacterium]|nr:hypothetical protein [Lachnospiraceae bacterium]